MHVRSRVPALSFGVNILHAPSGAHVNSYQRAPPAFWRPLRSNHPKDMSIYALSYYSAVINISANTANVAVRRVRIRANAFNCRNTDTRSVPWQSTVGGNGPPVILLQGRNCEISDSVRLESVVTRHRAHGNQTAYVAVEPNEKPVWLHNK